MISLLQEIINVLPALKTRKTYIRINHGGILKAVLYSMDLQDRHSEVFQVLNTAREEKYSGPRVENCLEEVLANPMNVVTLSKLFLQEETLLVVQSAVMEMIKRNKEAIAIAKKAFEQLKLVLSHADAMGNKVCYRVHLPVLATHCYEAMSPVKA